MSEENLNVGTAIPGEAVGGSSLAAEAAPVVASKYEEAARTQGWVPKDEWDGDPEAWRPAKEFVERGELFNTIHELRSESKKLKEALSFLTDHHKKVKETEFTRALTVLKAEKKRALEEGDADRLLQVDDAIDIVKQQKAAQAAEESQPQTRDNTPTPTFVEWRNANSWYQRDQEMTQFADEVGLGYYQRNPGAAEMDVYNYVAKRVKQAFADKFKGQGAKNSAVEGATNTRPTTNQSIKLTEEQERVMKTFVRQGVMTADEYKKELQRIGAV